jgi:hypothetical protein
LIVKRVDPDAPLRLAIANKRANLDFEWNNLSGMQDDLVSSTDPDPTQGPGKRDDSPPVLIAVHPADDWTGGQLKMLFNEPIKLGTGRFYFRNVSDWSETTLTVGDPRLSVDGPPSQGSSLLREDATAGQAGAAGRVLSITPPADLADGERRIGAITGWEAGALVAFLNPRGDGTWYTNDDLQDKGRGRGMIGSMRGPLMASIGAARPGTAIRSVFAEIGKAKENASFSGYTIRLVSGDTILAELTDDTPPGPPNSVTTVGFSWDSSTLPEGLAPGAPLAIEIAPNDASGLDPGYLDVDNVRVTVVGE